MLAICSLSEVLPCASSRSSGVPGQRNRKAPEKPLDIALRRKEIGGLTAKLYLHTPEAGEELRVAPGETRRIAL